MMRFERIGELRASLQAERAKGKRVGFVPTMGALHDGHTSLVKTCHGISDHVVASIFVNPMQFGPGEDFAKYPRTLESDLAKLEKENTNSVFIPERAEIFPEGDLTRVQPGAAAARWEGEARPGHFAGVLTIVAKLFNIVQPDVAVFGRKDYQQAVVVRAMVHDLNMPVSVEVAPTVRDTDGLALSSRNAYLKPEERARAVAIPRSLTALHTIWLRGERQSETLIAAARKVLEDAGLDRVDYLALVDPVTLEPRGTADHGSVVLVAVRVGATRLIDNILLEGP